MVQFCQILRGFLDYELEGIIFPVLIENRDEGYLQWYYHVQKAYKQKLLTKMKSKILYLPGLTMSVQTRLTQLVRNPMIILGGMILRIGIT